MKNLKLKVKSEIKKYVSPEFEVIEVNSCDIITSSPGVETPWYEESDGIWEIGI